MKILYILVLLMSWSAFSQESSFLIPKDYEKTNKFVKLQSYHINGFAEKYFRYLSCSGTIAIHNCTRIPKLNNISESKMNSVKSSQQIKGTLLAGTELVGGGILWKNLVKFTLPQFYKVVRKSTGWSEGVAIGTVALIPATTTSAGATVVIINQLNGFFESVDPVDRFRSASLLNSNRKNNEVILVKYGNGKLIEKLNQILI